MGWEERGTDPGRRGLIGPISRGSTTRDTGPAGTDQKREAKEADPRAGPTGGTDGDMSPMETTSGTKRAAITRRERRKGGTKVKGRKAKGRGTTTENGTAEMIEPGARNEREEGATRVLSKCEG